MSDNIPLSGGDYNGGAVLGGTYELRPGDVFRIVGHPDPAILTAHYEMYPNGVARFIGTTTERPVMEEFSYTLIGDL